MAMGQLEGQGYGKNKRLLKQAPTLKYYDPNKDVVLSVDASQHAIGAVLLQEDRPIAYASSALNDAQRHYPQIEKEALAIKFGCKKFHTYICVDKERNGVTQVCEEITRQTHRERFKRLHLITSCRILTSRFISLHIQT
ncbi:K02A2.6-like [Cordylochernes scorpioides]|uniref:K02A2.6-like n=1 Tax=Cordylochernes scorpioides TaxID=51811 RepID=A0ABY6LMU5_9ARAC|nr:K02A2.6-like [Cordylochernes scorpioides]